MLNIHEEDLDRFFDTMSGVLGANVFDEDRCVEVMYRFASGLVALGWDETGLSSGATRRAMRRAEGKPYAGCLRLALRMASPEPTLLDSHAGNVGWLSFDPARAALVLRLADGSQVLREATQEGWNELVWAWGVFSGNDRDLDAAKKYVID